MNKLFGLECADQNSLSSVASASARLLQRFSPLDYREVQASALARPLPSLEVSGRVTVLVFRLRQEWFALAASLCRQVLSPLPAHTLPHRSNSTLIGTVNVAGQMRLKVSLSDLLGLDLLGSARNKFADNVPHRDAYPRMVVVERMNAAKTDATKTETWVFEVDELEGIISLEADRLEVPAVDAQISGNLTHRVFCWQAASVSWLDDERLFAALRQQAL